MQLVIDLEFPMMDMLVFGNNSKYKYKYKKYKFS